MKRAAERDGGASSAADEERIAEILDAYLAKVEAGRLAPTSELFAAHPTLAPRLQSCLESLRMLGELSPHAGAELLVRGAAAGTTLGDYRLVREIGRGGMGVVYEAVQLSLGRRVALKMLPLAMMFDQRALRRFRIEALAAAQLDHNHIVRVYGVGCERGIHHYSMQYVEGTNLAQFIDGLRQDRPTEKHRCGTSGCVATETSSRLNIDAKCELNSLATCVGSRTELAGAESHCRRVARLGMQAADALAHAHSHGVIHRDIKPSNLLVDAQDHLWVADFGVARVLDEPRLTIASDMVGTLRYMSPEQALGKHDDVDVQSDVYSLGVTLYELLTLDCPFAATSRSDLLQQITTVAPRPPRRVNPAIPVDLETIVLKAMSRRPERRYTSAAALRDDLQRFLDHRAIEARPASVCQRIAHWARRRRPAACAMLFAAIFVSIMGWMVSHGRAMRLDQPPGRQNAKQDQQEPITAMRLPGPGPIHGAQEATVTLDRASPQPPDQSADRLDQLQRSPMVPRERIGDGARHRRIDSVAVSPDGRWAASGGAEGLVVLWDVEQSSVVHQFHGHTLPVQQLAFSPAGDLLCSAANFNSTGGELILWDIERRCELRRIDNDHANYGSLQFSPDGRHLYVGGVQHGLGPWQGFEVATGKRCVAFGGQYYVIGAVIPGRQDWAVSGTAAAKASPFDNVLIEDAVEQPDGKIVLAGFEAQSSRGRKLAVLRVNPDGTPDVNFGECGVAAFDLTDGDDYLTAVSLDKQGRIVVAGTIGGSSSEAAALVMRITRDGSLDTSFGVEGIARVPVSQFHDLDIQSDGQIVAAGTLWDGEKHRSLVARYDDNGVLDTDFGVAGKVLTSFTDGEQIATALRIQDDGKLLLGVRDTDRRQMLLVRYQTDGQLDPTFGGDGAVFAQVGTARSEVQCLALDSQGRIVAGGSVGHGGGCQFAAARFHADGQLDLSFHGHGFVQHHVGSKGEANSILVDSDNRITLGGYVCSDGKWRMTAIRYLPDGTLDESFADHGELRLNAEDLPSQVRWLLSQPRGAMLVGGHVGQDKPLVPLMFRCRADGSVDAAVKLRHYSIELEQGEIVLVDRDLQTVERLTAHGSRVCELACSPDGQTLASAGLNDNMVCLWNLHATRLVTSVPVTGNALCFSPDSRCLAIAHRGTGDAPYSTVELYAAETGLLQASVGLLSQQIRDIAFTPDGRTLIAGIADGTLRFWEIANLDGG